MMTGYGSLHENLEFQERELPKLRKDQMLIKVHAASINPIDYKIVDGLLKRMEKLKFPAPMGFDASGTVLEIRDDNSPFHIGDKVFIRTGRQNKGTFATHLIADAHQISLMPNRLNFLEAASLPLVGLTTVQHLTEYTQAKSGQHIFINVGAGGIGTFAIQYAKALGLEVSVQCNSRDEAFLKPLGVDHFIFYDRESYLDKGPIFDIVYDCLGQEHTIRSFSVVKSGGIVASIAGPPDRDFADRENLGVLAKLFLSFASRKVYKAAKSAKAKYVRALTRPDATQLDHIRKLADAEKINAVVGRVFPFEETIEALAFVKAGKAKGKVVIKIP